MTGGYACPGCSAPMQRRTLARKPQGTVDIDLCFECRGIWFDAMESAALAPGAVIDLFRAIHEEQADIQRPPGDAMRCPACRKVLALTHDIQRTTRITYYRCPTGDGRFTSFYQFLREKSFVRELTPVEVTKLRATIQQVKCSSCGAPIDLARDAACRYCHAPLAILDADSVKAALADLSQAEQRRHEVDPAAAIQAALAGQQVERRLAKYDPRSASVAGGAGLDLVAAAIGFLMEEF